MANAAPSAIGPCAEPITLRFPPRSVGLGHSDGFEDRDERVEPVEGVEAGVRLDDRQEGHDRPAADEHPNDQVDLLARPNDADDQVEDEDEAREERQLLRHLAVHVEPRDPHFVEDDRAEGGGDEEEDRNLETARTEAHTGVDEQRAEPHGRDHRDVHPVGLELEREAPRQRVPLDRDEQDHEHEPASSAGQARSVR